MIEDPHTGTRVISTLGVVALALGLVIVWKAVRGYRQSGDRAMLLLAAGLFLLVLAPLPIYIFGPLLLDESIEAEILLDVVEQAFKVAGLAAILASMYVRR